MRKDVSQTLSKVPDHLRPFQRPSLLVDPVLRNDNIYAIQASPRRSVELCPPHWRLPPKRSLRSTLKAIVLKEWPPHTSPTHVRSPSHNRPLIMRMKDSDDYITARAANPRTGLISPSIGCPTPQPWDTPSSPGEALHNRDEPQQSPTPEYKERPALKRANEGRKVGSVAHSMWKADQNGWSTEIAVKTASPRITNAQVQGGLVSSRSQPVLHEDALIVRMPSAQEPQPYAYPGYSAKQIEALKRCNRKARRVSGEGYDERTLQSIRQSSSRSGASASGIRKISTGNRIGNHSVICNMSNHHDEYSPRMENGSTRIARRGIDSPGLDAGLIGDHCNGSADAQFAHFAPFISPRTPAMGAGHQSQTKLQEHLSTNADDPKFLPRRGLVHPTLPALPPTHRHRQNADSEVGQKCSLGCVRASDGSACIEQRTSLTAANPSIGHPLFDRRVDNKAPRPSQDDHSGSTQGTPQLLEILSTVIISVSAACRHILLPMIPHIGIIDVLRSEHKSPKEKVNALSSILYLTGQALVFFAITTTLWQVGSAIIHVLEIVFWPVLLPFKALKWVAGGN